MNELKADNLQCIYRFGQSSLNACKGCSWFTFDDCSNDCSAAINDARRVINSLPFAEGISRAINKVFENAPRTKLFVTGYPRFWNPDTDYCDKVSFKVNCPNNSVLPLTKERRKAMNELTDLLNGKIKGIIDNWPTHADLFYVNTDEKFNGHRFCEEGTQEPSYRNPNIWFYPYEYSTGGQSVPFDGKDMTSGDCAALLQSGGDQGDYFSCLMANSVHDGGTLDLNTLSNNAGDSPISSQKQIPDSLARIFHPNINGMTAYRDAIIDAYEKYSPRQVPFEAGTCNITLKQTREHFGGGGPDTFGWKGQIYDNKNAEINGCSTGYEIHASTEDFGVSCDVIRGKVNVHISADDELEFSLGDQKWKSDDQNVCHIEQDWGITPDIGKTVRTLRTRYANGLLTTT